MDLLAFTSGIAIGALLAHALRLWAGAGAPPEISEWTLPHHEAPPAPPAPRAVTRLSNRERTTP